MFPLLKAKYMKITNILKPSDQPCLNVVRELSQFSVLFRHHANVLEESHHVDTKTERTSEPDPDKSGPDYRWFY
jgi:hypothetical protein